MALKLFHLLQQDPAVRQTDELLGKGTPDNGVEVILVEGMRMVVREV